jgi:hypothetical protein
MRHRHFSCRHKRFKISLEVAVPFTVAINSDATILPHATADELIVEVGHCDAQWHAWLMRHTRRSQCVHDRGGVQMVASRLFWLSTTAE